MEKIENSNPYRKSLPKEVRQLISDGKITGQDIDWTDMGENKQKNETGDEEEDDVEDESTEESAESGKR